MAAMQSWTRILFFLVLSALLSGCAGGAAPPLPSPVERENTPKAKPAASAPSISIPAPKLPPNLLAASANSSASPANQQASDNATNSAIDDGKETTAGSGIAYEVKTSTAQSAVVQGASPSSTASAQSAASYSEIVTVFETNNILHRLIETPPRSLTGLEQRLQVALKEGQEVLYAYGYYGGKIRGQIILAANGESASSKALVEVVFTPGPLYKMGATRVTPTASLAASQSASRASSQASDPAVRYPTSLTDVDLPKGAPAVAGQILAAVEKVRDRYRDNGYPFAAIATTRYIVDHKACALEAEITVQPGDFVCMGEVERRGTDQVTLSYLDALKNWKPGRPWSQSRIETFRDALRGSGLFQSVEIAPGEHEGQEHQRPVVVTLGGAPERTVGVSVKYHSDFGPGILTSWEHRNLTGNGDRLRLEMPLWMDLQEAFGTYRFPFFLDNSQDAIVRAGFLNQNTDAYELQSASASAGVERRFSRRLSGNVQGSLEGGFIKDPNEPRRSYSLYGLPVGVRYDSTNDLLNATEGVRVIASVTPYTGAYGDNFSVVRTRLDAQAFVPVTTDDTLVMAFRGAWGQMTGADAGKVPPSVRFYSGGGGSVRGYKYQSLGPQNEDKDPLGGAALLEISSEARWRITEEWGLVSFLDSGMAYANVGDSIQDGMHFGAGLGVRYYTAIGPVRLDVASPLNPRKDDDPWQFYISIGQSF